MVELKDAAKHFEWVTKYKEEPYEDQRINKILLEYVRNIVGIMK